MKRMKDLLLGGVSGLAIGLAGLAYAQTITSSLQQSQDPRGLVGVDANGGVWLLKGGHLGSNNAYGGTSPSTGACGTGPTIAGTDFAFTLTTGTTATTALDPVEAIARVAGEHKLWLHVDAAMAGSAMILPECRWMWQGVEGADSLVLNPHKWLGVAFDGSLYYVRDPEHLVRVLSTNPSYLRSAADSQVKNLRDWGIPLGRRFRALKFWFLLREQGVAQLQNRLRRDLENAQWFADQVRQAPGWRVLAPVPLQTVCIRHEPEGMTGEALDAHTLGWADRINRSGAAYLTPAILDGRWMVRVSIGAILTEREHVAALWERIRKQAGGD